jgi:hypothetical protein
LDFGSKIGFTVFLFYVDLGLVRNKKTLGLKNRGNYILSPNETFAVIEELPHALRLFALFLVVCVMSQ